MMDDRRFEALIQEALARRGRPAPFAIDVADRVMARVAELPAPRRSEITRPQIVRWAAAAAVGALSLLALALWKGPSLDAVVGSLGTAMASLTTAASKLVVPMSGVLEGLRRAVAAMVGSAGAMAQPLVRFEPLARFAVAAATAGMLVVTTFIVGRDMRSRAVE